MFINDVDPPAGTTARPDGGYEVNKCSKDVDFKCLPYNFVGNRKKSSLIRITSRACAAVFPIYTVFCRLDIRVLLIGLHICA